MLTAVLAAAGSAAASTFSISPVRIEMDGGHETGVLTLHNDGDAPVAVQVQAVAWSQPDENDDYQPTRDLLVTPPVFVLGAKRDQIVRVARRTRIATGQEQAYRLFFQEIPDVAPLGFTGLRIALRIGVPVFVLAPVPAPNDLSWQANWLADGSLRVEATNRGLAHVQLIDFSVTTGNDVVIAQVGGSRYLLPGSHGSWTVVPTAAVEHGGSLRIRGSSDRGEIVADIVTSGP